MQKSPLLTKQAFFVFIWGNRELRKILLTKQANRFYVLGEREHIDGLNFLYLVPAVYKRF